MRWKKHLNKNFDASLECYYPVTAFVKWHQLIFIIYYICYKYFRKEKSTIRKIQIQKMNIGINYS